MVKYMLSCSPLQKVAEISPGSYDNKELHAISASIYDNKHAKTHQKVPAAVRMQVFLQDLPCAFLANQIHGSAKTVDGPWRRGWTQNSEKKAEF